jgi:hypothetical protein
MKRFFRSGKTSQKPRKLLPRLSFTGKGQGNITEVTFVSMIMGQRFFPFAFSPIADGPV